jgi:hypothetical protein
VAEVDVQAGLQLCRECLQNINEMTLPGRPVWRPIMRRCFILMGFEKWMITAPATRPGGTYSGKITEVQISLDRIGLEAAGGSSNF